MTHDERCSRRRRRLPIHPTQKVLLLSLQSPIYPSRARSPGEHTLFSIAVVWPASLVPAQVILSIYITAVNVGNGKAAAFSSPRCWTCIQMFGVGLSCWAPRLLCPGYRPRSLFVAISLMRGAHPRPRSCRVFCTHQDRLLPVTPRRINSVPRSTTLPVRNRNTGLKNLKTTIYSLYSLLLLKARILKFLNKFYLTWKYPAVPPWLCFVGQAGIFYAHTHVQGYHSTVLGYHVSPEQP